MDSTAPTPPVLPWSDTLLTGHLAMDEEHREFVSLVRALQTCPDEQFAARLEEFRVHALSHFGSEDGWMAASGYSKADCHVAEHRAVIESVVEVQGLVAGAAAGALAVGRRLAQELASWFPAHVQHLDSALAHWMSSRTRGGKPIVLRRNVARTSGIDHVPPRPAGPANHSSPSAHGHPHGS